MLLEPSSRGGDHSVVAQEGSLVYDYDLGSAPYYL